MTCLLALGFFASVDAGEPPANALIAQALMKKAWEANDQQDRVVDQLRRPGTSPVLRMIADAGNVDLIVLSGSSASVLDLGPGHLASSALPGEPGNTVITGRRDTYFRFLADLEVDDSLAIETRAGQKHLYRVVGIDVVDARRSSVVLDTPLPMLSLVTGYPFDPAEPRGSLSYVVTARRLF